MNLYGFAGGDPVNFSDPLGLFIMEIGVPLRALVPLARASATFRTMWDGLAGSKRTSVYIYACSAGCDQRVIGNRGGFTHSRLISGLHMRSDVSVNDVAYSDRALLERFVHELVHAAADADRLAKTGITCNGDESPQECAERWTATIMKQIDAAESGREQRQDPADREGS